MNLKRRIKVNHVFFNEKEKRQQIDYQKHTFQTIVNNLMFKKNKEKSLGTRKYLEPKVERVRLQENLAK